jgi:hypothetical protein
MPACASGPGGFVPCRQAKERGPKERASLVFYNYYNY